MTATPNLTQLRTLIAHLDHPDGTLTNREQLMLDSLRSAASFAEINSTARRRMPPNCWRA